MESSLLDVVVDGRLELLEQLARPDMVDEANQAFGGPPGPDGLVAHVRGVRRAIGGLQVDRVVGGHGSFRPTEPAPS